MPGSGISRYKSKRFAPFLSRTSFLTGKGRKTRIVPLLKETSSILKKYIHVYKLDEISKQDTPLFFNVRGEKLTRQGITYILQKYADSANIESISPHVIRHSKAMHLTDADINPIYIKGLSWPFRFENNTYLLKNQRRNET